MPASNFEFSSEVQPTALCWLQLIWLDLRARVSALITGERCKIAQTDVLYDVFVSFATENRRAAESAVQALEANGYKCWVAWRDIPEGVPYAEAIVQGIRSARVLLILLTPESRSSPHVLREVECAVSANRPILSVQMAGCLPGEALAYYLGPTEWLRNEQTELDVAPLVAAVSKMLKDARSANEVVDGKRRLVTLFRGALRFPVGILWATGLALATIMEIWALVLRDPREGFGEEVTMLDQIRAVQHRSILLILVGCFLWLAFVLEGAFERRRAPVNPLRGRLVPSYSLVAGLFMILGLWVWSLATGLSLGFLATGSSPGLKYSEGIGIPDFLSGFGPETEFWGRILTLFSLKPGWEDSLLPLIVLVATAMVLASVALCVQWLVRSSTLALSIVAVLPFFLVRWFIDDVGRHNPPALIYWAGPVCAALLALGLRSAVRSRWPAL